MKLTNTRTVSSQMGFTLIEVTLVVGVLLGLTSILFLGGAAYKRGADRTNCIQNIATVQKAVRSHENFYDYRPGDSIPGLFNELIGPGKYLEEAPVCPANGAYTFGGDNMPTPGSLYLTCDIGDHVPNPHTTW